MERVWATANETAKYGSNLEIIFYIDAIVQHPSEKAPRIVSDVNSINKFEEMKKLGRVNAIIENYIKFGGNMWNRAYTKATGDILLICADDLIFKSNNWDEAVISAFEEVPDRILLVHAKDEGHPEPTETYPFIHRNWVETLGYVVSPFLIDVTRFLNKWHFEIAQTIGRIKYLPDVLIEHNHWPLDQEDYVRRRAYQERLKFDNLNKRLYMDLLDERKADILKLQEIIE